jgi:hypothetical protein
VEQPKTDGQGYQGQQKIPGHPHVIEPNYRSGQVNQLHQLKFHAVISFCAIIKFFQLKITAAQQKTSSLAKMLCSQ